MDWAQNARRCRSAGRVIFGLGWVLRNRKGDGSTMASENAIERKRGAVESRERVNSLRERWPLAFPIARADVRPLAIGSHEVIADAMGWGVAFTLGVVQLYQAGLAVVAPWNLYHA
jgi:hypothetical protein